MALGSVTVGKFIAAGGLVDDDNNDDDGGDDDDDDNDADDAAAAFRTCATVLGPVRLNSSSFAFSLSEVIEEAAEAAEGEAVLVVGAMVVSAESALPPAVGAVWPARLTCFSCATPELEIRLTLPTEAFGAATPFVETAVDAEE